MGQNQHGKDSDLDLGAEFFQLLKQRGNCNY